MVAVPLQKTEYNCFPPEVNPRKNPAEVFAGWERRTAQIIRHFAGTTECLDSASSQERKGLVLQTSASGAFDYGPEAEPSESLFADFATLSEVRGPIIKHFDRGATFVSNEIEPNKVYRGCMHYPEYTSVMTAALTIAFFANSASTVKS